jgi:hypothetical protein
LNKTPEISTENGKLTQIEIENEKNFTGVGESVA